MAELDWGEARTTVAEFLELLNQNKAAYDAYRPMSPNFSGQPSPRDHPSHFKLLQLQPYIEQIAEVVDPQGPNDRFKPQGQSWKWRIAREAGERLAGVVNQPERRDALFPSRGPSLNAEGLHDWVWDAARTRWDDGYYSDAVSAAAEAVQHKARVRLGRRDLTGATLYEQAFSPNDATDKNPRLRLSHIDPEDADTWRSAHLGAMHLGSAAAMGIRNLAAHHQADLAEQEALEQLAVLSVLARWVDASERHPDGGES